MRLQKHHRLALQAVRRLCPGMEAQLHPTRKHPKLVVRYAGRVVQITVSSSPGCVEDVVRHSVRDVLSRFARFGVSIRSLHG